MRSQSEAETAVIPLWRSGAWALVGAALGLTDAALVLTSDPRPVVPWTEAIATVALCAVSTAATCALSALVFEILFFYGVLARGGLASLGHRVLHPVLTVSALVAFGIWLDSTTHEGLIPDRWPPSEPALARTDAARPNVVLISIDTLRADHLGLYGYTRNTSPQIDALGRESEIYAAAYTQSNWTLPSHVSMLTGLNPLVHGVVSQSLGLTPSHRTLAERLRAVDYVTVGWVGRNDYSYLGSARGFDKGFDFYFHSPHLPVWLRGAIVSRSARGLRWRAERAVGTGGPEVDSIVSWIEASPPEPFFAFIHLDDVHGKAAGLPYQAPPPYFDRFCPGELDDFSGCSHGHCASRWLEAVRRGEVPPPNAEELRNLVCLYDGAVQYEDMLVGRIVTALRERDLLDSTLIVLTSDHGEAFNEHGGLAHYSVYDEVARVPLLIRWPGGGRAGRVEALAELIDIVPTVLAATGTPADDPLEGVSLLTAGSRSPSRTAFTHANRARFSIQLRRGSDKYIWSPRRLRPTRGDDHPEQEFYDLAIDPHEQHSLAADQPDRLQRAHDELEARVAASKALHDRLFSQQAPLVVEIPEAERERLRALGYTE